MKKIFFSVLCACAVCGGATKASAQYFDWGVKGGLNFATITDADEAKMKPSIYVGVFAEFVLIDDYLAIQPEVVYSRQGTKNDDVKLRMNYLNVPVIFKLYLLEGLSLDLGPQFGFMLNSKWKGEDENGTDITIDAEGYKNFDVSMGMGLSYRFIPQMDVTARYNLGLTKVYDEDGAKSKNSVIQIGVGYRF